MNFNNRKVYVGSGLILDEAENETIHTIRPSTSV